MHELQRINKLYHKSKSKVVSDNFTFANLLVSTLQQKPQKSILLHKIPNQPKHRIITIGKQRSRYALLTTRVRILVETGLILYFCSIIELRKMSM